MMMPWCNEIGISSAFRAGWTWPRPIRPPRTRFYGGLFGWEFDERMPSGSAGHYFVARLDGADVAAIGSPAPGSGPAPSWATYIAVDDADATAAAVWTAGGAVLVEPVDVHDAGRMAVCTDPSGAEFRLWQAGRHHGAQLVNLPGSWNFSDLHTPAPDRARAFYGAVFGWEVLTFVLGEVEAAMWRRPGYGDDLERLEPGLLQRQAEQGAPAGFADVVAALVPVDQPDATGSAHWGVAFTATDIDATAQRAVELGGDVRVQPFDVGPVRTATLADPAGGIFTVNHFDPQRARD